jgi:hypothetical protein
MSRCVDGLLGRCQRFGGMLLPSSGMYVDDYRVDGVRLRLLTAAIKGPIIVYPACDISVGETTDSSTRAL